MTVSQAIAQADAVKPNAFSNDTKVGWLNEAEGYIHTDVLLRHPNDFTPYTWANNQATALTVRFYPPSSSFS